MNVSPFVFLQNDTVAGADPGFFLGGGALVSCSTSTPINHIAFFFFLQNTSCTRKPQVILGGRRGGGVQTPCTLPLDPPPLYKGHFFSSRDKKNPYNKELKQLRGRR